MHKKIPFILTSALLMSIAPLHADEVRLATATPIGETIQIALNADLKAEIIWENGEKQTIVCNGSLQTIAVKSRKFTLSSTEGNITSLYVQGDKLTDLNVDAAPEIKSLYAADNKLTSLYVYKLKKLTDLDVQDNELTFLALTDNIALKNLNVANNNLTSTSFSVASTARFDNLVVANNQLSSALPASVLRNTKNYWAQNNNFSSISLSNCNNFHSLVLSGNKLSAITLIKQPQLTDLWIDNNEIQTLNLSNGAPLLRTIAADHNKLTSIQWDVTNNKKSLKYAYLNDNQLFPGSLPTRSLLTDFVYAPQTDYELDESYELNTPIDLSALLLKNGFESNISTNVKFVDNKGNVLAKGTDYTDSRRQYTFKTPHAGIRLEATCSTFPGITFCTSRFNVGNVIDAIYNVADNNGQTYAINTTDGGITIITSVATPIHITDIKGATIANKTLNGTQTWDVPTGIYIVNGQKVVVTR